MKSFVINLNNTLKISLSAKEHLVPPRAHVSRRTNTYIMYFVTGGELLLRVNGEEMRLARGDLVLFDKGDSQSPVACTDCEYFYIHFEGDLTAKELSDGDLFDEIVTKNRAFSQSDRLDPRRYEHFKAAIPQRMHVDNSELFEYLSSEFKALHLCLWDVGIEKRLELSQGVAALTVKLERLWINSYLSEQKDGYLKNLSLSARIAGFVEANYNKNFSSDDIARSFLISYDHANRIFKNQKGMGIIAYRNHLRIEKAKVLLLTTDKSVEMIASDVGFEDKYYFSKFFKRAVGVSPTQFKRGEQFAF